jgi:hypothetical protein
MANAFNDFFTSVADKYLPDSIPNRENDFVNLQEYVQSKLPAGEQCHIPQVDCCTVERELKKLSPNKAVGLDGISSKLLSISANIIAPSITKILNCSLTTGQFPVGKLPGLSQFTKGETLIIQGTIDQSLYSAHYQSFLNVMCMTLFIPT